MSIEYARVDLPSGEQVLLAFEPDGSHAMAYAGLTDRITNVPLHVFERGIDAAIALVQYIQTRMAVASSSYSDAELTFGIEVTASGDVKVLRAEGRGAFELTVRWKGVP